jgi:hypothetical protein
VLLCVAVVNNANRVWIRCGGMVGVYFLVKRCSLLYLYAGNGAFLPPPYLDMHGEIDISLRYVLGRDDMHTH